jgi:serine/threonine protein phosphatase PrpC
MCLEAPDSKHSRQSRRVSQGGKKTSPGRLSKKPMPADTYKSPRQARDSSADLRTEISGALGDLTRHGFGLAHKPAIKRLTLREAGPEDAEKGGQFLVCCSYGIWDMVHTYEAAPLVGSFGRKRAGEAAASLCREAAGRWGDEEETDDVSVIVLWL